MTSLIRPLLAVLLCCLAVTGVLAAEKENKRFLYQWTDDQGGAHITDDAQKIPQNYRSRATQIGQPAAGKVGTDGPAQRDLPSAGRDAGDAAVEEALKKAEWQQRMIDAKLRLRLAEDNFGQLENRKRELQAQWGSAGAALPTQEAMDEMKQLDVDLVTAREAVDKARDVVTNVIPDEARRAGVLPGWLREVE